MTPSKGAVTARQADTVAGANFLVPTVSTDGTAVNPAAVRMVLIAMEQMEGAFALQASRETNVSKSARRERLVRHAVSSAIVEDSSAIRRMGSVFVRWADMEHSVRRSAGQGGTERVAPTSVNASMEPVVIPRPVNAVALQDGSVRHVKWKCWTPII